MGNKGEKLPNNTVFSKKILDFFLFLCVFGTALNCSAQEYTSAYIACTDICEEEGCNIPEGLTGDTIADKCNNVKGCKYTSFCSYGNENYYTESGTLSECTAPYNKSATGSWSINQCYKEVNCAGATEATASTINPTKCRIYYSGKVVCATQNISSCVANWSSTNVPADNICDLNQASVEGFTNNDTYLSYEYHREIQNENPVCYSNTRACNLFTSETSPVDNVSGGPATWVRANASDPGHWNVSICRKTEPFNNSNQITIFNNEHPNCTGVKVSQPTGNNTSVNSATAQITYTGVGYFCTQCNFGYSITNPLSSNTNLHLVYTNNNNNSVSNYVSSDYCTSNTNSPWSVDISQGFYVCNCIEPANGYYVDVGQTICNSDNDYNGCKLSELPGFSVFVKSCPAGKTSDYGATSAAQCHYGSGSNGTQFCDAFGCVWLDGLSFDSTNPTYYWTGDVHLVGVSNNENADYLCPVYPDPPHFWGYDKDGNPIDTDGDIVNCGN